MDTHVQTQPAPRHPHQGGRRRSRDLPVFLSASFLGLALVLLLITLFAGSPADQVSADTGAHLAGGTNVAGLAPDGTSGELAFSAALVDGPIKLGQPGHLSVTVRNPSDSAVILEGIRVEVAATSPSECRAEWLVVSPYRPRRSDVVTIPAGASSAVLLPYLLANAVDTNQDACKGAEFSLVISGSGHSV